MIPQLLGGGSAATGILGERKVSIPNLPSPSSSSTCASTPPSTTSVLNSLNTSNIGGNNNNNLETTQNLKCPRCNSTNTKFCYYNNYNLTQPRHFCKMCRRYWTKGGTLRKVPIGGGCRKNKTINIASGSSTTSGILKSSSNAMASFSAEKLVNGNSSFLGNGLMDHLHHHHHHYHHPELQPAASSPILWPSLPQSQNSHILALLAGTSQFHNPSPTSTVFTACFKTEACTTLGLDSYVSGAPSGCGSFPRSNQHRLNGIANGGKDFVQNSGSSSNIMELYQMRLKSSANYSNSGNENPTVLEATSMGGGGDNTLGGYNIMTSAISSWSDFPMIPISDAFP